MNPGRLTSCLLPFLLAASLASHQVLAAGISGALIAGILSGIGKSLRPDTAPPDKFMIFGGKNHKQYLGCLSCSEYASDSVFNKYSSFGSQFSDTSIYNRFSQYGSRYSDYSACNPNADDPPVIVDEKGLFYGRLTVSRSHNQRVRDGDLLQWLLSVCG